MLVWNFKWLDGNPVSLTRATTKQEMCLQTNNVQTVKRKLICLLDEDLKKRNKR